MVKSKNVLKNEIQVLIHIRTQYILINTYYIPDTYNACNIHVVICGILFS